MLLLHKTKNNLSTKIASQFILHNFSAIQEGVFFFILGESGWCSRLSTFLLLLQFSVMALVCE